MNEIMLFVLFHPHDIPPSTILSRSIYAVTLQPWLLVALDGFSLAPPAHLGFREFRPFCFPVGGDLGTLLFSLTCATYASAFMAGHRCGCRNGRQDDWGGGGPCCLGAPPLWQGAGGCGRWWGAGFMSPQCCSLALYGAWHYCAVARGRRYISAAATEFCCNGGRARVPRHRRYLCPSPPGSVQPTTRPALLC